MLFEIKTQILVGPGFPLYKPLLPRVMMGYTQKIRTFGLESFRSLNDGGEEKEVQKKNRKGKDLKYSDM